MASKVQPWMEQIVEKEINSLLSWSQHRANAHGIKQDPAALSYASNGGTLRSEVSSTSLRMDCPVQLVQVVSLVEPVTLTVSDTNVSLNVQLTRDAVARFEREIDCKLESTLKGDIIHFRRFAISITNIGPMSRRLQLSVLDLDYITTHRKLLGEPTPLVQSSGITALLLQHRDRQRPSVSGVVQHESSPASVGANHGSHTSPVVKIEEDERPPSSNGQDQSTGDPVAASAVSHSRGRARRVQDVRNNDDIQLLSGINLSQPVQASGSLYGTSALSSRQPAQRNTPLLQLINRGKNQLKEKATDDRTRLESVDAVTENPSQLPRPGDQPPSSQQEVHTAVPKSASSSIGGKSMTTGTAPCSSKDDAVTTLTHKGPKESNVQDLSKAVEQLIDTARAPAMNDSPPHGKRTQSNKPVAKASHTRPADREAPPTKVTPSQEPRTTAAAARILTDNTPASPSGLTTSLHAGVAPPAKQSDDPAIQEEKPVNGVVLPARHFVTQPQRFTVSDVQATLLARKSSWVPPPVGEQFPHPNVPIAILEGWNAEQTVLQKQNKKVSINVGKQTEHKVVLPQSRPAHSTSDGSSSEDSEADSDSEISQSEWPASSPPPNRPPPDSGDELEIVNQQQSRKRSATDRDDIPDGGSTRDRKRQRAANGSVDSELRRSSVGNAGEGASALTRGVHYVPAQENIDDLEEYVPRALPSQPGKKLSLQTMDRRGYNGSGSDVASTLKTVASSHATGYSEGEAGNRSPIATGESIDISAATSARRDESIQEPIANSANAVQPWNADSARIVVEEAIIPASQPPIPSVDRNTVKFGHEPRETLHMPSPDARQRSSLLKDPRVVTVDQGSKLQSGNTALNHATSPQSAKAQSSCLSSSLPVAGNKSLKPRRSIPWAGSLQTNTTSDEKTSPGSAALADMSGSKRRLPAEATPTTNGGKNRMSEEISSLDVVNQHNTLAQPSNELLSELSNDEYEEDDALTSFEMFAMQWKALRPGGALTTLKAHPPPFVWKAKVLSWSL